MQNLHVNCDQTFPWTINNVIICRKHAISYNQYVEYAGIRQKKLAPDQQEKITTKIDRICRENAISSSADPRHIVYSHLICMYMYIHVIYTAHIYLRMMPFLEVTILFNQHFIIVGKIPDEHSNPIYLVLKPQKLQIS